MSKIFGIWPRICDLQADLGGQYNKVRAWVLRGEIPQAYDGKVIQAVEAFGYTTSWERLSSWHEAHTTRRRLLRERGLVGGEVDAPPMPPLPFTKCIVTAAAREAAE